MSTQSAVPALQQLLKELIATFGKNVAMARSSLDLTQRELAELSGVPRPTIGKIESFNTDEVSFSTLLKLSEAFAVPPYVLLMSEQDWNAVARITDLERTVLARAPSLASELGAEKMKRLEERSRSKSAEIQREAHVELQRIAALFQSPEGSGSPNKDPRSDKEAAAVRQMTRPAVALSSSMLPDKPVMNALIALSICAPFQRIFKTLKNK